jgi:hypothetical protein
MCFEITSKQFFTLVFTIHKSDAFAKISQQKLGLMDKIVPKNL